jgi:hypothetical protein
VDEDVAITVDEKGRDVAFAFLAHAFGDATEADQADHGADRLRAVSHRNADDHRRLIQFRQVLERAGVGLAGNGYLPRCIHLVHDTGIDAGWFRFGALTLPVEHAQRDQVGVTRDVVTDPPRLGGVDEWVCAARQGLVHDADAAGDLIELLGVTCQQVLDVGCDTDRRAGEVLLLERLQ